MVYDTIIIGSGPAGLTAAIYAARAALSTLVIGGEKWGGQLMLTTNVENFPGFVEGIQGPDLMNNMRKQAERLGVTILDKNVTGVDFTERPFRVFTDEVGDEKWEDGENRAKAVIIATGAETVWLNVPGEKKLIGHGVSSCAPCDAFFFKNKKVIVVGGGDSAMEEALVLSKFAAEVTIIHRRDTFRASKIMQERVLKIPNVKTLMNTVVEEVLGEEKVEGVKIKSLKELKELKLDGVFVAIGHRPSTEIFKGQVEVDEKGFIVRKEINKYSMMTNVPGVFVAGDVYDYKYKQAITAAGMGCMAALEVSNWLEENKQDMYE